MVELTENDFGMIRDLFGLKKTSKLGCKRCSVVSVFVFCSQHVKQWQTHCSTQCGLWAADPT